MDRLPGGDDDGQEQRGPAEVEAGRYLPGGKRPDADYDFLVLEEEVQDCHRIARERRLAARQNWQGESAPVARDRHVATL